MTFQTILAVGAWVFSMVAVSIAIRTRTKANDKSDWIEHRINRITEKFCEVERLRSCDKGEFWSLSKRVDDLANQLAEEEDCEPCRPRTCCGTAGDKVVMLVTNENEIAKNVFWKNQYGELSAKYDQAVEENKRLRDTIETVARVSGYCDKKKGE